MLNLTNETKRERLFEDFEPWKTAVLHESSKKPSRICSLVFCKCSLRNSTISSVFGEVLLRNSQVDCIMHYQLSKTGKVTRKQRQEVWEELQSAARRGMTRPFCRAINDHGLMFAGQYFYVRVYINPVCIHCGVHNKVSRSF